MNIVILNFVTGLVGQVYEDVMSQGSVFTYCNRCNMNYEKAMIVKFLRKFWLYADKEVDTYIILGGLISEDGDDWEGISNAIKKNNAKQFNKTNKYFKQEIDDMNAKIDGINSKLGDSSETIID